MPLLIIVLVIAPVSALLDRRDLQTKFPAMLSSTVKEFARAVPFVPFIVQLIDGRKFKVDHPDYVSVSPQGSKLIVYDTKDNETHLSGLLVASVAPARTRRRPRHSKPA